MNENPLAQWADDLLSLVMMAYFGIKRMLAVKTIHAYLKFALLWIFPACVGFGTTPTICQAQPADPHQPHIQVQSNGTTVFEPQTATVSATGSSPNVVQINTGDLVMVGERTAVKIFVVNSKASE